MNISALITYHNEAASLLKDIQAGNALLKVIPGDNQTIEGITKLHSQYADRVIKIAGDGIEKMRHAVYRDNCVTIAEEFYL